MADALNPPPAIESLKPAPPGGGALNLSPAIESPDDFYEALLDAHAGLSAEQSADLNARLVLVLANQVGRLEVLREAIAVARRGVAA